MSHPHPSPAAPPHVTVVVIGRNEGERLRRCLQSVHAMDYPAACRDVIYVDSDSTDNSVALARSFDAVVVTLKGRTTAGRGRNAGWTRTHAPFVLFLDGDTVLHPAFVQLALAAMQDATVAGVGGRRREVDGAGSLYNAVFDQDWLAAPGPQPNFGGDALVRTEALRRVGGFNESLVGGEEPEMCRRLRALRYTILQIDAPMTGHDLAIHTFGPYWRRSLRTGYAYAEVSALYARTSDPTWLRESRHNILRGLFWLLLPLAVLTLPVPTRSLLPSVALLALALVPIGRTALRMRPRVGNWKQAIAYGAHAHLQNIPILVGQVNFWTNGSQPAVKLPPAIPDTSR